MKLQIRLLSLVFVLFLMACGGGGGGGSSSNDNSSNDISAETKQELAVAAKETSAQIMASESDVEVPDFGMPLMMANNELKAVLAATPEKQMAFFTKQGGMQQPQATDVGERTIDGTCGGEASASWVVTSDDTDGYPITMDFDYDLVDFCIDIDEGYWIIYNGIIELDILATDAENATYKYLFDISYTTNILGHDSGSIYYAESCTLTDGEPTCSTGVYESEKTTYHTSDVDVTGDNESGYNISYTITDDDGNECTVVFTGLTICENDNIGSGSGTITINGEVLNIEFISCDEFTVTYNGETETYSQ